MPSEIVEVEIERAEQRRTKGEAPLLVVSCPRLRQTVPIDACETCGRLVGLRTPFRTGRRVIHVQCRPADSERAEASRAEATACGPESEP